MVQFLLKGGSTAGVNTKLHKVNLIPGEQPVGQPQCNGGAVQASGRDVIGRGCG